MMWPDVHSKSQTVPKGVEVTLLRQDCYPGDPNPYKTHHFLILTKENLYLTLNQTLLMLNLIMCFSAETFQNISDVP